MQHKIPLTSEGEANYQPFWYYDTKRKQKALRGESESLQLMEEEWYLLSLEIEWESSINTYSVPGSKEGEHDHGLD